MKLWSWYSHSWYPGFDFEIGFDLRQWFVGFGYNFGSWQVWIGPVIIARNSG